MPLRPFRATQSGMTMFSLLAILAILAFVFTFAIRLVPVYLEHFNVISSLKNVAKEASTSTVKISKSEIRSSMLRQFSVNDIDLSRDVVAIETKGKRTKVTVDYEVRKPFVGNIDLVVHFSNSVEF